MKKIISKKQWNEITHDQMKEFWGEEYHHNNPDIFLFDLPDISEMIEFLGEDWYAGFFKVKYGYVAENKDVYNELCNNLWEAVKNKLA